MEQLMECINLEQIREQIDLLDKEIVKLLAKRAGYVKNAAKYKNTEVDVRAKDRVEQVIGKVRTLAMTYNMNPDLAEQIYRHMIASFVNYEMKEAAKSKNI